MERYLRWIYWVSETRALGIEIILNPEVIFFFWFITFLSFWSISSTLRRQNARPGLGDPLPFFPPKMEYFWNFFFSFPDTCPTHWVSETQATWVKFPGGYRHEFSTFRSRSSNFEWFCNRTMTEKSEFKIFDELVKKKRNRLWICFLILQFYIFFPYFHSVD